MQAEHSRPAVSQNRDLVPADSWAAIAGVGLLAMLMGTAFLVLRPDFILLPEDRRFTGLTTDELRRAHPALFV